MMVMLPSSQVMPMKSLNLYDLPVWTSTNPSGKPSMELKVSVGVVVGR